MGIEIGMGINFNQVIDGEREWEFCFLEKFPHLLIRIKSEVGVQRRQPVKATLPIL